MEAINFKVASDEYQLLPHTGFDAIDLDRKVLGLIGKMARQGLDINDDVEAFALLANTLSELSTPDFKWLLETTLSAVTVVTKGQKFVTLDSFVETGKAKPFRDGSGDGAEWSLNSSNPIVNAFSDADAKDIKALGKIGTLKGGAADYALVWRIVKTARVPLSDIEKNWTFERMMSFAAYIDMENDYRSAWGQYYKQKEKNKNE